VFGPSGLTLSKERRLRFEEDRLILAGIFPRVRHIVFMDGSGAVAEGPVEVDVGAGCFEPVQIRLVFDGDYPARPPRVFDWARRWRPEIDRHLYANGEFCLWLDRVDVPDVTSPTGFGLFLKRLLVFLHDQFVYDDLGRWPGPEWPHGPQAAYAQHLIEHLRVAEPGSFRRLWPVLLGAPQRPDRACPCGSGLVYGSCHRRTVEDLSWIRGLEIRDLLPDAVEGRLRDAA
jgi:SEC-C motif